MISRIHEVFDRQILSRLRSGYTRALENEVGRLRAENRALVNSILGLAGIPPMSVAADAVADVWPDQADSKVHGGTRRCNNSINAHAAPLRKRSWRQIGRALEVEDALAARRERESDADAFPAPRNIVPHV